MSRLWTDGRQTTECEDRARILETEFAIDSGEQCKEIFSDVSVKVQGKFWDV